MSFTKDVKKELLELKAWNAKSPLEDAEQIARICVREAFIKSGAINDPNKKYHLQILFKEEKNAVQIKQILTNFNINPRILKKEKQYMLYLKDGEEISDFLALIGANKSVLKFEEVRVIKETRNEINRKVNCETANLNKTISAAVKQIEDIKFIKRLRKFNSMPENLQEIANLRLDNPDISLIELGKMLEQPIGKSGVNHRLKRINEIAEELRRKK